MGDEQPIKQDDLVPRIGTFLMLLGTFFFILFLASDLSDQTDFDWLFLGVLLFLVGYLFRRRAPSPPPSGRFSGLRKWRENAKKRKQEKAEKKKVKK
jgi:hypothetical protein